MAQIDITCITSARPAPNRMGLWALLTLWRNTARSRQALARLDADRLADLGITAKTAQKEADRPFWDVPAHWLK